MLSMLAHWVEYTNELYVTKIVPKSELAMSCNCGCVVNLRKANQLEVHGTVKYKLYVNCAIVIN